MKKDRQHNSQTMIYKILHLKLKTDNTIIKTKSTNNGLQNITYKTKDRVTRTPLIPGVTSGIPKGWTVLAPLVHERLTTVIRVRDFHFAIDYVDKSYKNNNLKENQQIRFTL